MVTGIAFVWPNFRGTWSKLIAGECAYIAPDGFEAWDPLDSYAKGGLLSEVTGSRCECAEGVDYARRDGMLTDCLSL